MKKPFKSLPILAVLVLSLGVPFAMADNADTLSGDRDKAKNDQISDKPDAYTVEDSKDNGLTSAKKPVRKLDHKQKIKGDKPVDSSNH